MAKRRSKTGKAVGKTAKFIWLLTKGGAKLLFVDSMRVVRDSYHFAKYPEKKLRLDRKLEVEKRVDHHEQRVKRMERLVYSMFNYPSYSKSNKGQDDLKELERKVK